MMITIQIIHLVLHHNILEIKKIFMFLDARISNFLWPGGNVD